MSAPIVARFSAQVRSHLWEQGTTLKQVAERMGVSESVVSRALRRDANPTVAMVLAIADAAGLEIELTVRPRSAPASHAEEK